MDARKHLEWLHAQAAEGDPLGVDAYTVGQIARMAIEALAELQAENIRLDGEVREVRKEVEQLAASEKTCRRIANEKTLEVMALREAIVRADLQIGDGHIEAARITLHDAMDAALSQPAAERESLPLMSEATFARLYDELDITDHPVVALNGQRFRVVNTDEHGLPVIPREPGMPEGAIYYVSGEYFSALPSRAVRDAGQCFRIEDFRPTPAA